MTSPAPVADPEIYLEPSEAERRKIEQRRWLNVAAYPFARLLGNVLVLACVFLHNVFILGEFSVGGYTALAGGILLYCAVSWLVLWRFYSPTARVDLGDVFMALDVVAWTFAIYGSGGERSWLFVTMVMRAADQRLAGPRRVLRFGAVSVASYAALIAWLGFGEGRPISWAAETAKLFIIVAAHLYLGLVARTTVAVRTKLLAAIRVARELLRTRHDLDARYRTLFETVSDPIMTSRLDGTITEVNRALELATGYSREELIGRHYSFLTTPAVAEASRERIRRLVAGEALPPAEIVGIGKDGRPVPYEVRTGLLHDAERTAVGAVAIYRDIRERKRIEDELSRARDAAERANRAKSQFLANMSHELRTPLNSILGFSRMLLRGREGELAPRQTAFVESMIQSATHLLQVISSVLDLARIEAGKLEVGLEDLDLATLLRETVESMRPLAAAKQLALDLDLPEPLPAIRADATRIRQVMFNILSNAIKFTSTGGVTVVARIRVDAVQVTVRDTGPGIPAADLPRLFEPFQDTALGREAGGTGLGLAISKSFVELHGGNLWVDTADTQGSAFHFTLPVN